MPARNSIKTYLPNSFYHIYNRGVEKRIIFTDDQDYNVFLKYLRESLQPIEENDVKRLVKTVTFKGQSFKGMPKIVKNFHKEIDLCCFCLMPNHFHLLIRQSSYKSMEKFMRSIMTRYTSYFNKKHKRIGGLFQGRYKAVLINSDEQLVEVSKYIHLNPKEKGIKIDHKLSSYKYYIESNIEDKWLNTNHILDYFSKKRSSYKMFVENQESEFNNVILLDSDL